MPFITTEDVVEFCLWVHDLGIEIWIDGGWGVDALLGEETRPHADLDIVVQQKDVSPVRAFLESEGYLDVPRDDTSPWNFVLSDDRGHEVDFHAIVFDEEGNGLYGPVEKGVMFPAASLTGIGSIGGRQVKCISPEWMVRFHSGYTLKEQDFHDVSVLCERFGIALPSEYEKFL
jgi:lincosamide nucleotidyltransferase A/C/D/E